MAKSRAQIIPIPDYEQYGCTRDGQVWRIAPAQSNKHNKTVPYPIKQQTHYNGVVYVTLYSGTPKKTHALKVAHLMAKCYLGDPKGKKVIHKNADPSDNRLTNLRVENVKSDSPHNIRRRARTMAARRNR